MKRKKRTLMPVLTVQQCSDESVNSQEPKSFETYAATVKTSMTEYTI